MGIEEGTLFTLVVGIDRDDHARQRLFDAEARRDVEVLREVRAAGDFEIVERL